MAKEDTLWTVKMMGHVNASMIYKTYEKYIPPPW